jgi:O-antigen biosynthesis protein
VHDVGLNSRSDPSLADRLLCPVVFMRPERLEESAWLGHVPFAFWLAEATKPLCFVELGTQAGVSYCAFLQAAERLAFPIKAFAVDTWVGDPHAGTYSEEVFPNLISHHDVRYSSFSTLLRMTFDQAAPYFDDGSIDLLHIDGYHTYEAVAHDFANWLPKLSSRAVVLLHDTNMREREFGVWRLWAEESARYPSFQFVHSYGLGILAIGSDAPEPIRWLVDQSRDPGATRQIWDFFSTLGQNVIEQRLRRNADALVAASAEHLKHVEAQLADAQCEDTRKTAALAEGKAYTGRLEEELRARDVALAEAARAAEASRAEREISAEALSDVRQAAHAQKIERQALSAALIQARRVGDAERAAAQGAGAERDKIAAALVSTEAEYRKAATALVEAGAYARHIEREFAKTVTALRQADGYARSLEAEFARTAAQKESLVVQLNAILHSTSWRLWAPIRASLTVVCAAVHTVASKSHLCKIMLARTKKILGSRGLEPVAGQSLYSASVERNSHGTPRVRPEQHHDSGAFDAKHHLAANAKANLEEFLTSNDRIAFSSSALPDISVLIVLWNQAHLTLRCLRALHHDIKGPLSAEVVLVDNASTDRTQELLVRLDGVQVIRNSENVGFVCATNQAAAVARGRLLLLLNNDAFIRPGALVAAQTTLGRAKDIGVVGGRIILPSGLLQEAGSIVWSDGSTMGYGRGLSPESGEAMFRREVDYVSGAFLMTPRSLWDTLGGFELSYSPGYYEDADYCMRAREIGYRVIYEPCSVIDHYENGSALRQEDAEAATLVNRQRFRDRHKKVLENNHSPYAAASLPLLVAREPRARKWHRLLVIDNEVPLPALGSGYPRMRKLLLEALAAGWSVSLFPLHQPGVQWAATRAEIPW